MNKAVGKERLISGYSGRLFLTVSFGWLLVQMGRQLIPPLLPNITSDFGISSAQAGVALSMMWGLYALFQYPSGRLSDRLSRKTVLAAGIIPLVIGFLVLLVTTSYGAFLFGLAVIGVGAGLYPTAARALTSDLFVARRGQAFGLHTASGDIGNASAAGLAVAAVALATWQAAFLPIVILLAGTLLAIHVWSREEYTVGMISLDVRSTGWRLLGNARLRWLLAAYAMFAFTWQSTTMFLPTLLQVEKNFSVGLASAGFALYFVIGSIIKPLAGLVGDRVGRAITAVGALLIGIVGLVGLIVASTTPLIFLAIGVFATGLMSFPPVMQAFLMDLFPDGSMGGDLGAIRSFYIGFGALGPAYVGFIAEIESYTASFITLVACLVIGAGIVTSIELRS
ncbi:MFS transporter [Halobellus sp. GM3]|uniref:MFS transporter n=1 Tax=Halobellus sp. GM3 TaxID=3458410 RepID=UPI00403DDE90